MQETVGAISSDGFLHVGGTRGHAPSHNKHSVRQAACCRPTSQTTF